MPETNISIQFKDRPSELIENQANRIEWSVGAHLETVRTFFGAGHAYEESREEITGEFHIMESVISKLLENARSLSMANMEETAQVFIAEARSRQRNFVIAAELLTPGTRTLTDIDWQTMDYRPDFSLLDKLRKQILGKGLVIGDQPISEKELREISADPVAKVRFYLTVFAVRNAELIGLKPEELVSELRRSTPLSQLRVRSNERLFTPPDEIDWPNLPRIMPEISITENDLK